jgi:hypothetical protein
MTGVQSRRPEALRRVSGVLYWSVDAKLTLLCAAIIDMDITVICLDQVHSQNDLAFQVKYRDTSAIESYSGFVFAGSPSVKDRGRHDDGR